MKGGASAPRAAPADAGMCTQTLPPISGLALPLPQIMKPQRLAETAAADCQAPRLANVLRLTACRVAAVVDLLAHKPHLASRRLAGNVGQGAVPTAHAVGLAGILRARSPILLRRPDEA